MSTKEDLQSLYTPLETASLDRVALFEKNLEWASIVARNVARKLRPSFEVADLEQVARIEMWKRCQLYDTQNERGVPFQAYAYLAVRGACLMSVRRRAWKEATNTSLERNFTPSKDGEHGGQGGRMGHAMPLGARDVDPGPLADARIEGEQTEQFQHARLVNFFSAVPPPIPEAILLLRSVALEGVDVDELARDRRLSRMELAKALQSGVRQLRKIHRTVAPERIPVAARPICFGPLLNGLPVRFAATARKVNGNFFAR
jgi:RNA polymerase sigma factor (sigma-70 family)